MKKYQIYGDPPWSNVKLELTNNGKPIRFEESVMLVSKVLIQTFLNPDGAPVLKEALRRLGYTLKEPKGELIMKNTKELEKKLKELEEKRNRWEDLDPEDYAAARAQLYLMRWVMSDSKLEK